MNEKIEYLKTRIADELRKIRAEKNYSQEDVINGINEKNGKRVINVGTLVRYEKGTVVQSLDKLAVILDFYEIDMDIFFKLIYENMYRNKEA